MPSGNLLIKRQLFDNLGGFRSEWPACEDVGLFSRLSGLQIDTLQLHYLPELSVIHAAHLLDPKQIRQKAQWMGFQRGALDHLLSVDLQIFKKIPHFLPAAVTGCLFAGLIIRRSFAKRSISFLRGLSLLPLLLFLCLLWATGLVRGRRSVR